MYHTSLDTVERVGNGSVQHMGQNSHSIIKELAHNTNLLTSQQTKNKVIYYNLFGKLLNFFLEFSDFLKATI